MLQRRVTLRAQGRLLRSMLPRMLLRKLLLLL
jgi:hypothetical protein